MQCNQDKINLTSKIISQRSHKTIGSHKTLPTQDKNQGETGQGREKNDKTNQGETRQGRDKVTRGKKYKKRHETREET